MASADAIKLRRRVEAYLGRGLTLRQVKHCEELVINFKPWVPLRYLESLSEMLSESRKHLRNWGLFYFPLYAMARKFRGFTRRKEMLFLTGRLHRIYQQCDLLGGDGYGEKDLSAILFLANDCTDNEISITLTIARVYKLRTLRHLRGIILKNRAVAIRPHLKSLKLDDEKVKSEIIRWEESHYPPVSALHKLYGSRIHNLAKGKSARRFVWDELQELNEEASHGNDPDGSDSGNESEEE